MKKKKVNVHFLRQNKPQKRRKFKTSEANKASVRDYFYLEDEAPKKWSIRASEVYSDYHYWCATEEITPCSEVVFRRLATIYVDKRQMTNGCIYYSPKDEVLMHLRLMSEASEAKRLAA